MSTTFFLLLEYLCTPLEVRSGNAWAWIVPVLLLIIPGGIPRAEGLEVKPVSLPLKIVSTANPNLFPLLVAMSKHADLNLEIIPATTNTDIVEKFRSGNGDVLLSMTYTAAQLAATGRIPNLKLIDVDFWNGFSIVAEESAQITGLSQLAGKGLLVAGPLSGGKGGGPDLILGAALKRAGVSPASIHLCYLPVMQAAPMLVQQEAMSSNSFCNDSDTMNPVAISLAEPAATGLILQSRMASSSKGRLTKAISLQKIFSGYSAWPNDLLPHGGISVPDEILNDPRRLEQVRALIKAYHEGVASIMAARGHPFAMMSIARAISSGIDQCFGNQGLSLPKSVIISALRSDDLVFSTSYPIDGIQRELERFLEEVIGAPLPPSFIGRI